MQESLPLLSIHEGNPSLQPLIQRFIGSVADRLVELRDAIVKSDRDEVKKAAHKFRGSASTFGFPQLTASIRRVEDTFLQSTRPESDHELKSAFSRLVHQCARLSTNGLHCDLDFTKLDLPPTQNSILRPGHKL